MQKVIKMQGFCYNDANGTFKPMELTVRISNDSKGKPLSIENGIIQFTVPYEPIEKAMGGNKS